jgi:hypothetical protein
MTVAPAIHANNAIARHGIDAPPAVVICDVVSGAALALNDVEAISWLAPRGGRTLAAARSLSLEGGSDTFETGAAVRTRTIGSSQRGKATDKAGAASALNRPSVHTK